jgi:hypothetical protein
MRDISLDGTGRTRHGAHLPPNAWRESRSRRENRYGKHAVHMIPVPPFRTTFKESCTSQWHFLRKRYLLPMSRDVTDM